MKMKQNKEPDIQAGFDAMIDYWIQDGSGYFPTNEEQIKAAISMFFALWPKSQLSTTLRNVSDRRHHPVNKYIEYRNVNYLQH
jgi:hypothetical protein